MQWQDHLSNIDLLNVQRVGWLIAFAIGFTALGCRNDLTSSDRHSDETRSRGTYSVAQKASTSSQPSNAGMSGMKSMKFPAPSEMKFKDEIDSNVRPMELPGELRDLVFRDTEGGQVALGNFVGKQNVILVFTEGFSGMLCPFCKTQTSRLISNYEEFKKRNCEILVVYPGPREKLDEFVHAALNTEKKQVERVPFPIVLDEDFAATGFFDIVSNHAHPSTFLMDRSGSIQFAYVGADMTADRPSVKALLKKLDELNGYDGPG